MPNTAFRENAGPQHESANEAVKNLIGVMQPALDSEIEPTGFRVRQQFLDNLRAARESIQGTESGPSLRPHQMNVYNDLIKTLENGAENGWIKLPTGSGKTALFATIAEACGLRTLVLVPNKNLVKQTADEFSRFAPNTSVSTFFSDSHSLAGKAVISTYQSLDRLINDSLEQGEEYDLVICDEAHRAIRGKRPELLEAIPGAAFKLGLTATPVVSKDKTVADTFGTCVHEMNLPDAISWGILTGVEVVTIQTNSDLSNVKFSASGEASERDLEKAIDFEERITAVIEIMKLPENEGKSFVGYWSSVSQAKEAARRLQEAGIPCCADTGDMDKDERGKNIEDHRVGVVQGMATKKTLVEGWDAPIVEIGFMCHPTMSAVDAEQRLGRVLRPYTFEDGRVKEVAIVYDFIDRGKKGILSSEVLGGKVRLAPERSTGDGVEETEEREPHHSVAITLSGDLKVLTTQEDVERLVNTYSAEVRITSDRLEQFLQQSLFVPQDLLGEKTFTAESPRGPQSISGIELLDNFGATHKGMEGVTLDPDGARKLAKYCKWTNDEVEVYLTIRKEIETIHQNYIRSDGSENNLQRAINRYFAEIDHPPSISEFASNKLTLGYDLPPTEGKSWEAVSVSGQTVLDYLGIKTGHEYLYYLIEKYDGLETEHLMALEHRHQEEPVALNEIHLRLSEQLNANSNIDSRREVARLVAQTVLSSIGFNTIEELKDATVNIKRSRNNPTLVEGNGTYQSVKFIGMYEYLEGLRRVEGIDANPPDELLNDAMMAALARKSGRSNTRLVQDVVLVRQQRVALKELADAELLAEQIQDSFPDLALRAEEKFLRSSIPGTDNQPIPGAVVLEYYKHLEELSDFNGMVQKVFSPEQVAESRQAARAELLQQFPKDLPNWRPDTFFKKEFPLENGTVLSGEDVLAVFGYSPANAEKFKAFSQSLRSEAQV